MAVDAGDLKAFFSDVVKPKSLGSPRSRPRSQSDKSVGKAGSPLVDNEQRIVAGESALSKHIHRRLFILGERK